ncbi:hypothetical protein [Leifsonia aquatica]|uniref:hypothetical protein n=1 Tax=Leifsonia aquatica TaxID=144185 RepID=UPI0038126299
MADVNVRQTIIDGIKPLLPKRWKLLPNNPNLDTLSQVTVTVRIDRIERTREAPQSHRDYYGVIRVIDPSQSIDKVDDAIDDDIIDLLNAIDELPLLSWTTAERGQVEGTQNFAFDITFKMLLRKDTTNG